MNLETLYDQLKQDKWRKDHAFSEDLEKVNRLLFDPFATEGERREQLMNWLQKYQSCVFGRGAAALNRLRILPRRSTRAENRHQGQGISAGLHVFV